MKRLLCICLCIAGLSSTSLAQDDDIYASGSDTRQLALIDSNKGHGHRQSDDGYRNNFHRGNDGNNNDVFNSYDNPDDYIDNDDASYGSRINRFNYSFYNQGYYNVFYNPYWYDPYWYDPYSGWNPWRPHFGISFGMGPCWTSYWGYSSWYGYGAWGSYWGYPYYGCGWNNYYGGGYWNRYYNNVEYRSNNNFGTHYGPRQIGNGYAGGHRSGSGLRMANPGNSGSIRPSAFNNQNNIVRGNDNAGNFANQRNNSSNSAGNRGAEQMHQSGFSRGISRIFGGGNNSNNNFVRSNPGNSGGSRFNNSGNNNTRGFFNGGGNRGGGQQNSSSASHSFGGGGSRSSGGGGGRSSGGGSHSGGGHGGRR